MTIHSLKVPLTTEIVTNLKLGDTVYLTGKIYTGRDEMHIHALELLHQGKTLPIDLRGGALYHCGPIVKKDNNTWKIVSAGPTTSSRMNSMEPEFIEKTGIKAIIGKGGMNQNVVETLKKHKGVYLSFTGGAGVLAARRITKVIDVHWLEELGVPEALWVLEVENFGPLIVSIDANGNSLYELVNKEVQKNAQRLKEKI